MLANKYDKNGKSKRICANQDTQQFKNSWRNSIVTFSLIFFFFPVDFLSSLVNLSKGGCSADLKPKVNTNIATRITNATGIYKTYWFETSWRISIVFKCSEIIVKLPRLTTKAISLVTQNRNNTSTIFWWRGRDVNKIHMFGSLSLHWH